MVGAGPFITIPLLLGTMQGPQAVIGWIIGAVVALCDGLAWAELGAAIPQSGGSYVFLLECYGPDRLGRLIDFHIRHGADALALPTHAGESDYGRQLSAIMLTGQ